MTLNISDKKSLSDIRFDKALEALGDAKANCKEERYRTTINRSYYAALNAVRALLILDGVNPESHTGVITTLSLRFIKSGILPVETIKDFKLLYSRRTDVDYGDFEYIDEKDAEDSIKKAEKLLELVDNQRKSIIKAFPMPYT